MNFFLVINLLIFTLSFSSCSKIPPLDNEFVSSTIDNRINNYVDWNQFYHEDQIECFIAFAISNALTPDTAIQIALLNNPKVQATFEELGIARADLVEAGLLSNPSFELEVRYPNMRGLQTNIEYLISSSLLDIFLIPIRKKIACIEFEQTKLKVSNELLNLAFEVRETYYELVSEKIKIQQMQTSVEILKIIKDISSKQIEAGNANPLESKLAQANLLSSEIELYLSEAEVIRLKEKLNRLLGLSNDVCLIFPPHLPHSDIFDFDLNILESIALDQRLDLQVARFEIIRLCQMLGLKEGWTYTNLKVGVSGERDTDGANLVGPAISGEIPIFNYGQASRMRLHAQLRQAQEKLKELELKVISEVREAHKLLINYWKIIKNYQNRLLPIQENITASSEELYEVMGLGIDKLLEKKRLEVVVNQDFIEVLKKYLIARVKLDQALGGYLFKIILDSHCQERFS